MSADGGLEGRCGTCARFVRVTEIVDENGEVKRSGQCLLGVWSPPLYETNTCSQYKKRGTVGIPTPREREARARRPRPMASRSSQAGERAHEAVPISLPEELLDMDAEEFRQVLREVLQDELGLSRAELGGRWQGGEMILKPGKEGTAEKRIPIEALFHKIVMIRDRLRVLEQKVNGHPQLSDEDKVQMQQYVTQCYGTLTTFNVLFAERRDSFVGQKGDRDD